MSTVCQGDEFLRQVAARPPFSKLHPRMAAFLAGYLAEEKVTRFGDRWVLNTHFPPYPGPAFDNLARHFGQTDRPALHSVTLAVTNRCSYRCWHCYNAGRAQQDLPLELLRRVAAELQEEGTVMLGLSGGEPLLRDDLEQIAEAFDERTCVTLNTTGHGLTPERARDLHASGIFAVGISLDDPEPAVHDRLRGRNGAHATALRALEWTATAGLYPYVVAMATRELLEPDRFWRYLEQVRQAGAREVHLLEPCPAGRLAGHVEVALTAEDRRRMLEYQHQAARREDLPAISSFAHLESPEAFGCGAGLTHLYLDGSGEVCPCNLVPISFGNVARESLAAILARMRVHFQRPRTVCVGHLLSPHIPAGPVPTPAELSERLCAEHLPASHEVPRFFRIREETGDQVVGQPELRAAYDRVHREYDDFWVAEAGTPVRRLIAELGASGVHRGLEVGCGTGFATTLLADQLAPSGHLLAVDLSPGMLSVARERLAGRSGVELRVGDALAALAEAEDLDLVFSSWVLGYIPCRPLYRAAARALRPGGRLAFVVHRDDSPREPLEIFTELVTRDPSVLLRQVSFDFPRDADQVRTELEEVGFQVERLWQGEIAFPCADAAAALEHLLKSGAGTAFHDAVDPVRRDRLMAEFRRLLDARHADGRPFAVVHEYLAAVATRS